MSHKVHPKAFRIKRIGDWNTRGYYKNPAKDLEEDFIIRKFLKRKIGKLGVEKIEIERFPNKVSIIVFSAKPGLIIGRGGEGIERLKSELEKEISKKKPAFADSAKEETGKEGQKVKIDIKEIKDFWASAKLSAQWIAQRLEKRMPYRRVLKQALGKILISKEIQGARLEIAGRINGAEIARKEWIASGKLPRQTIRANIDYAKEEAHCSYGVIGVKVWIYRGEKFE